MGTILASAIIDKAEIILQDTTNVRWEESEHLGWLNDGVKEVLINKPDAYVLNSAVQLTTGTKQSVPSGGLMLIKVPRNMGTDGVTPGRAVTITEQTILDQARPNWHTETGVAEVKHYMFDERDPKHFYVYPPQPAASQGYVEIIYSSVPSDLTATSEAIPIDDIYANVLLDYILYRAYTKDADYSSNGERAIAHRQAFLEALGVKESIEAAQTPNTDKRELINR